MMLLNYGFSYITKIYGLLHIEINYVKCYRCIEMKNMKNLTICINWIEGLWLGSYKTSSPAIEISNSSRIPNPSTTVHLLVEKLINAPGYMR